MNAFGHGSRMITPKQARRNNFKQRADGRGKQKEGQNIFTVLDTEEVVDVQKERHVISNAQNEDINGRMKGMNNDSKKQKIEQGLRSVNVNEVVSRGAQNPTKNQQEQTKQQKEQTKPKTCPTRPSSTKVQREKGKEVLVMHLQEEAGELKAQETIDKMETG